MGSNYLRWSALRFTLLASSVAAALLVERGYEVIGMMMKLWSEQTVV